MWILPYLVEFYWILLNLLNLIESCYILSNLIKFCQILLNVSNIDKSLKILSNLVESCQTLSNLVFLHFKIFLSHFICIFNFEICSLIYLWLFSFSTYIQSCPVQSLPIFLPAQPFRLFFSLVLLLDETNTHASCKKPVYFVQNTINFNKKDWKKMTPRYFQILKNF